MSFAVTDPTPTAPVRTDAAWLDAHWMPYTGNRQFKANPRMIVEGSGAYYTDSEGRKIFDGLSGLWCAGLGHGRREIAEAIGKQAMKLDYAPAFQFGHPLSFELANRVKELTPAGLDYVFFTGSGSESADTSLKMARAYWRAKGQGTKTRLIGREKGYHGVNFGGISVGGLPANRKTFGQIFHHHRHTTLIWIITFGNKQYFHLFLFYSKPVMMRNTLKRFSTNRAIYENSVIKTDINSHST